MQVDIGEITRKGSPHILPIQSSEGAPEQCSDARERGGDCAILLPEVYPDFCSLRRSRENRRLAPPRHHVVQPRASLAGVERAAGIVHTSTASACDTAGVRL